MYSLLPADVQQVMIPEVATEEWRPSVDQQNPGPLHITEEEEEKLCSCWRKSSSVWKKRPMTPVCPPLKSDDDDEDKPLLS